MATLAGAPLVVAVVLLGSIPAVVLAMVLWSIRAQKRARLEMKRHVQKMEATEGA